MNIAAPCVAQPSMTTKAL